MNLKVSEKIKVLAKRQGITLEELACKIGISRQTLYRKMTKNNFTEDELTEIAVILGAKLLCIFKYPDGTEI